MAMNTVPVPSHPANPIFNELTTLYLNNTLSADAVADMARAAKADAAYRAEVAEHSAAYDWSGFSL